MKIINEDLRRHYHNHIMINLHLEISNLISPPPRSFIMTHLYTHLYICLVDQLRNNLVLQIKNKLGK
jgi:hypothetical protein